MELSSQPDPLTLGLDLGTGGARAIVADISGRVVARSTASIEQSPIVDEVHEQEPEAWWAAARQAISEAIRTVGQVGAAADSLLGLSIDGTSGTLVCVDEANRALRPSIMYNDGRAKEEAEELNEMADDFIQRFGYRFEASFALAKIYWIKRHDPEVFDKTAWFAHQADYVMWRLTGQPGFTDYGNALKTGFDLIEERWPEWIDELVGGERLPEAIAPGTRVGAISEEAATATGLPAGLAVVSGTTDGTAACVASGLNRPGDYNTTLGTTLVFKGINRELLKDPHGLIYCHKLPGGRWLPGAASNTGGEWIEQSFAAGRLEDLNAKARQWLPSNCLVYPLARQGERFPFKCADARGFCVGKPAATEESYAAHLQGAAFVERLGYRLLDDLAGLGDNSDGGEVYSTGGGTSSDVWCQCRADLTGRVVHRPKAPESAFGSAILAASGVYYYSLSDAIENMVEIGDSFFPNARTRGRYDALFGRFCEELKERGYF